MNAKSLTHEVGPIICMVAGALFFYAGLSNQAVQSTRTDLNYTTLNGLGIVQTVGGAALALVGVGWFIKHKMGSSSPDKPDVVPVIPPGFGSDDPSFVSIAKAIEQTTSYTDDQIELKRKTFDSEVELLKKKRDERVAALKAIKPPGGVQ